MKRYLSIVLDEKCRVSHTIIGNDAYLLDKYIYDNFSNSEDIRKKYAEEINEFLLRYEKTIKTIEEKNNKMYRGSIVILEAHEDSSINRVKVIYKNDAKKIKDEYIKNQKLMQEYISKHKKYFSDYVYYKCKRTLSKTDFENTINEWYRQIKNTEDYFEMCRSIIKFFNNHNEKENNKNLNVSNEQNEKIQNMIDTEILSEDDSWDPDFDFHPDLDDIERGKYQDDEIFVINDEEETEKPKTLTKKKKKVDPNQLSFF